MVYRSLYTKEEQKVRRADARRRYYLKTKTVHHANSIRWRRNNPGKYAAALRKHDLKRHYGLTPEQWDEIFTSQGSKCAGCGSTHPRIKTGKWSTDHCHSTGRVRGILCRGCNSAIGHAMDSPVTLRTLADYLERGGL